MAEVPDTLEGWYVLHDFRTLDWAAWKALGASEQSHAISEATAFLRTAESAESGEGVSAVYQMVGHKSDLLLLHLRPTIETLGQVERAFAQTRFADFTHRSESYVSVTELSLYEAYARGGTSDPALLMEQPFVQARLKPAVPAEMPYISFYPMNKRRGETLNWYTEDMEERRRMMRQHGDVGRKYRGKVQQMITGSTGLDDWEWGVTLFATDPLPIKKLVYEMRFDEVSAKFAEFGAFQIGVRLSPESLPAYLSGKPVSTVSLP